MSPEIVVSMIVAIASALGLREWGPGLIQSLTGRAGREKERIRAEQEAARKERAEEIENLRTERDTAEREADVQACMRRMLQEYVSELRGVLLQNGISVPSYPDLKKCRGES